MTSRLLLIASGLLTLSITGKASLVAHYTFDEGASATTATNEVSGSSTGAVGNLVTTGVAGISGNAYSFTGGAAQDNIVDMGNASFLPSITAGGGYTLSAWIKSTESDGNRNVVVFAGDNTDSNSYIDLGTSNDGGLATPGQAYMRNRVDTNGAGASGTFGGDSNVVIDDQWHHIAMTADASTLTINLYVDGVFAATDSISPGSSGNFPILNNFEIGRLGRSSPVDGYAGLVDDVQVYDEALSDSEVSYLFANPGQAVPEPGSLALAGLGFLTLVRRRRA
jgi:MYXO-CTERM domain-containing protein